MFGALSSTVISCGEPPKKTTDSSSTDGSTNTNFADNTAVYLTITSQWDTDDATAPITTHGNCSITSLEAPGTVKNCKIKVPEGQMYHSKINFVVGTKMSDLCPMMVFKPYVYRISERDDDYIPNKETANATCATTPDDPKCFGGSMTYFLGNDYPEYSFLFFISAGLGSNTFTLPSENKTRWYKSNPKKNYLATNNMSYAARAADQAGIYVGGSMEDYQIMCVDLWYHPLYTINLILADEDTKNQDGTLDEISDWNGTFAF